MKNLILFSILFFQSILLFGQNKDHYFKTIPTINQDTPEWAKMMYGEDPNVREVDFEYYQYYKNNPFEKNIHTQNYKHWKNTIEFDLNKTGFIRPQDHQRQSLIPTLSNRNTMTPWVNIGPFETYNESEQGGFPVSWQANIYCLDQSVSNPDILFAGTESGGIFKTTDKGLTWSFTSFNEPIVTVWDIKIAPTNPDIVYVVSNEIIFKTTDGGGTWQELYDINSGAYQLEIHPSNPDIVFLAGENGLYQTTDGGSNWSLIQNGKSWDIKFHPGNTDILYLLKTNTTDNRCEVFKSENGGSTWTLKDNGWYVPTSSADAQDIGARIGITPAAPDLIYVAMIGQSKADDNGWIGVYKSEDAGESWNNPNLPDGGPYDTNTHQNLASINTNGTGFHQGFYNFGINVSHNNPDKLWVGCLSLSQSTNGGASWERIGGYSTGPNDIGWIHPDVQDLHVLGDDIWVCTDGGINYSNDELVNHTSRKSGIYGANYWGFGQGWNQDVLVGGRYHNGNSGYYQTYGIGNFLRLGGAEAGTGYVNPLKERKAYFSDISTKILPLNIDGPTTNLSQLSLYPNETYSVSYSSEIEFHPYYADHFYLGKDNRVWKSENEGGAFDLLYEFPIEGRVLEIEISRAVPEMMYCVFQPGTSYWNNCELYRSMDGGMTWEELNLPTNSTWRLEISTNPVNESELWVISLDGADGEVVYRTTDGGDTWENKSATFMNDHVIYDVAYVGSPDQHVYIVTDKGFFYWDNSLNDWVDYSEGLPFLVRPLQMEPFYRDGKIRLATRGRGIYETNLAQEPLPLAQPMTTTDKIYCSRDTVQFDCYSILNHQGATWEWNFVPTPTYVSDLNIRNPRVVFSEEGTYDVELTVIDANGDGSSKYISEMVTVFNNCQPDTIPGFALACSTDGDYASSPNIGLTTNEFTMTAWVKPDGTQNAYTGIVMNNGAAAGINFKENNELGYHWPGGQWWWDSGLFAPDGEWSYVALVATPTSVTVYVNGVASVHDINIEPVAMTSFLMGSYQGWGGRNYNGEIDEVTLWNRSLSQEEIRDLRHLTKTEEVLNDPTIVAYYQFNETEGSILDRAGIQHAVLNGNAARVNSSAPVGSGTAHRLSVNDQGTYLFENTGFSWTLPEGAYPDGEVIATRLHLLPNELPNDFPNIGNYWIVNNYGNEFFSVLSELRFTPLFDDITNAMVSTPSSAILYHRNENEHLENWEDHGGAASADNDFLAFNESANIGFDGQFFITSNNEDLQVIGDQMTAVNSLEDESSARLYPNPVLKTNNIIIENENGESLRLRLFGAGGKLVKDVILGNSNSAINIPNLSSGIYFYTLEGDTFIKTGKLVVE